MRPSPRTAANPVRTHHSPSHPCCLHSCRCRRTVDRSTDIPGRSCSGTVCWGDTGISLHQQTETNGDGERRRHSQAVTLVTSCRSASARSQSGLSHRCEQAPETKAKRLKQRQPSVAGPRRGKAQPLCPVLPQPQLSARQLWSRASPQPCPPGTAGGAKERCPSPSGCQLRQCLPSLAAGCQGDCTPGAGKGKATSLTALLGVFV